MKVIVSQVERKRPNWPNIVAIFIVGMVSLIAVGANLMLMESRIGWVILLLAKMSFNLIPPGIWIGGIFMVILWLAVLVRVWHLQGDV